MSNIIKNPFCYSGSKSRILPLIEQNLPQNCTTMIDIFGGSGEVGLNLDFDNIFYSDKNTYIVDLIKAIKEMPLDYLLDNIIAIIDFWQLSKDDKKSFLKLRTNFNERVYKFLCHKNKELRWEANLYLLVLCFYSFNHQIIFNKEGKFSVPAGTHRSSYNKSIEQKLISYKQRLDELGDKFEIVNFDFRLMYDLICKKYNNNLENIFFFIDSPYLLSDSTYDRTYGMKWTTQDEVDLYNMCYDINNKGGKFMLTNLIKSKGITNEYLLNFSKVFKTINTGAEFSNCNHQRKNKKSDTEVMIINY